MCPSCNKGTDPRWICRSQPEAAFYPSRTKSPSRSTKCRNRAASDRHKCPSTVEASSNRLFLTFRTPTHRGFLLIFSSNVPPIFLFCLLSHLLVYLHTRLATSVFLLPIQRVSVALLSWIDRGHFKRSADARPLPGFSFRGLLKDEKGHRCYCNSRYRVSANRQWSEIEKLILLINFEKPLSSAEIKNRYQTWLSIYQNYLTLYLSELFPFENYW